MSPRMSCCIRILRRSRISNFLHGLPGKKIPVRLTESAHHKRLRDFSKGMRQKCGIAIAIIKDAPAILLDEPTSGLDPKAGREFIDLLTILRDEGKAILMSTHDIFRAREVADEIGIMSAGRMVIRKRRSELQGEDLEKLYMTYMAGKQETQPFV